MTSSPVPQLTIVIPAFNEEQRLVRTLEAASGWLDSEGRDWELIVVDDGSSDGTVKVVAEAAVRQPRISCIELGVNQGKGAAVRRGMLAARGRRVLFMDADLATPMNQLSLLERALDEGASVAIGSRGTKGSSVRRSQGFLRQNMGKTFNLIVRAVALDGIRDTQCGFKLFTREAVDAIFPRTTVDRFAFDVELLILARELGFSIAEVPIEWFHVPESRVSPGGDALKMLLDVVRIRWRHRNLRSLP